MTAKERRRLLLPVLVAALAALSVAVFVVALLVWFTANGVSNREAEHFREALAAASAARVDIARRSAAVDLRLCRALEAVREINNRDRRTFQRSLVTLRGYQARGVRIAGFDIAAAIRMTERELAARPFLKPLRCAALPTVRRSS